MIRKRRKIVVRQIQVFQNHIQYGKRKRLVQINGVCIRIIRIDKFLPEPVILCSFRHPHDNTSLKTISIKRIKTANITLEGIYSPAC